MLIWVGVCWFIAAEEHCIRKHVETSPEGRSGRQRGVIDDCMHAATGPCGSRTLSDVLSRR